MGCAARRGRSPLYAGSSDDLPDSELQPDGGVSGGGGHTNGDIPFTTLDDIEGELKERKDGVNVVVTSGALLMTTLVSAAVTQYLGLDVFRWLTPPTDLGRFATDCWTWSAVSVVFITAWNSYHLFSSSESNREQPWKMQVEDSLDMYAGMKKDYAWQQIAASNVLLGLGEVVIFQGTGLAVVTEAFTGAQWPSAVLSGGGMEDLLHIQLFAQSHLPSSWLWPLLALATGALQATVLTTALEMPLERHVERDQLRDVMYCDLRAAAGREPVHIPDPGRPLPQESMAILHRDIAKQLSLDSLLNTIGVFGEAHAEFMRKRDFLHYEPLPSLVAGTYLAAEVLLTGSLMTALVTATAWSVAGVAWDEVCHNKAGAV